MSLAAITFIVVMVGIVLYTWLNVRYQLLKSKYKKLNIDLATTEGKYWNNESDYKKEINALCEQRDKLEQDLMKAMSALEQSRKQIKVLRIIPAIVYDSIIIGDTKYVKE